MGDSRPLLFTGIDRFVGYGISDWSGGLGAEFRVTCFRGSRGDSVGVTFGVEKGFRSERELLRFFFRVVALSPIRASPMDASVGALLWALLGR